MTDLDTQLLREGPVDSAMAFQAADEIERLRLNRNEIIEECVKAIEQYGLRCHRAGASKDYPATTAAACIYHIRQLKL